MPRRRFAPVVARGATPPAITGTKPWSRKAEATGSITPASNPPKVSGVAIGRSKVPMPAFNAASPKTWTSAGLSANGRIQLNAWRSDALRLSGVSGTWSSTRAACRRGPVKVAASVISSIGVMPAIGSLENWPSEYETAPTRRPSMYTGLPLMPAITPVLASGPPSSRARIRFRRGPIALRSTPRMWTVNSSRRSPSKTVFPTPTIPALSSSTGKVRLWAGRPAARIRHRAAAEARNLMNMVEGSISKSTGKPLKLQGPEPPSVDSRRTSAIQWAFGFCADAAPV